MYLQGHTEPQSGRPRFTVTLKIALFSLRGRKRYFLLFLYAKITKIKVTNKKILSHVTMRESSNLVKVGRPRAPAACPYKYIINDLQSILYHEKPYFTRFLECLHLAPIMCRICCRRHVSELLPVFSSIFSKFHVNL